MKSESVDWSQLWYPGPTRVYTPAEMARAGSDAPSRTLRTAAMINYALLAFLVMQFAPHAATAGLTLLLTVSGFIGALGAQRLWRRPTRRDLTIVTAVGTGLMLITLVLTLEIKGLHPGLPARDWVKGTGIVLSVMAAVVWWFTAVYRGHLVESRLRELAEQERRLDMARQLAAAQIQPHFLFNTLATLQHWVHERDERAPPLLDALTAFLRATLPLFNRATLTLGEELQAVRSYLDVMQARLGDRLRVSLDVPQALLGTALPSGLLLTLVENALEHGVQPSLHGAEVALTATRDGPFVTLAVEDSGPGLAADAADGVGLTNSRARLAELGGAQATLTLENRPGGGCRAAVRLPAIPHEPC